MRRPLVSAFVATVLLAGCGPRPLPEAPTVSLRMLGGPPGATVTIDDQFVGSLDVVSARGVALPPGRHRLSVEAPGYLPYDKVLEAKDRPVLVEVQLVPVPD
jgi:hypothetical protein